MIKTQQISELDNDLNKINDKHECKINYSYKSTQRTCDFDGLWTNVEGEKGFGLVAKG